MPSTLAEKSLLNAYPQLLNPADKELAKGLKQLPISRYTKGEMLFSPGEACSHYFFVLSGSIKVQRNTEDGHLIVLYHVRPGQCCELTTTCLLAGHNHSAEAMAEESSNLILIPKTQFGQLLYRSDTFKSFVFSSIDDGVNSLVDLVEKVAFGHKDIRLSQFLLKNRNNKNHIELTHQVIATELGSAREVVSRLLKTFERRGWLILHRGSIEVTNINALENISKAN